jgi:hypothetical protein
MWRVESNREVEHLLPWRHGLVNRGLKIKGFKSFIFSLQKYRVSRTTRLRFWSIRQATGKE